MVSTWKGIEKLYNIHKKEKEDVQVYVLPPTRDPDLSFYRLLDAAENKNDGIWNMLDQKRTAWLELVAATLKEEDKKAVSEYITQSFESIKDILKAVWILEDKSGAASDHLETMTSLFLEKIVSSYFLQRGESVESKELNKLLSDHNPSF